MHSFLETPCNRPHADEFRLPILFELVVDGAGVLHIYDNMSITNMTFTLLKRVSDDHDKDHAYRLRHLSSRWDKLLDGTR